MKKMALVGLILVTSLTLSGCTLTDKLANQAKETAKNKIAEKVDEVQQKAENKAEEKAGKLDKLSDMLHLNKPQKCTWESEDGATGTVYIDGQGRTYVEVKNTATLDGNQGTMYSIIDKDMTYTWSNNSKKGMKIQTNLDDLKEEAGDDTESTSPDITEMLKKAHGYQCKVWLVNPKLFTPPSDIEFVDLSKITNALLGGEGSSKADLTALCDFAESEADKADCLKSMEKMGGLEQ